MWTKTTIEKANFCSNTMFLPYFKIRVKFTPQKNSLFRSISCFGVTKITASIWLSIKIFLEMSTKSKNVHLKLIFSGVQILLGTNSGWETAFVNYLCELLFVEISLLLWKAKKNNFDIRFFSGFCEIFITWLGNLFSFVVLHLITTVVRIELPQLANAGDTNIGSILFCPPT